MSTLAAEKFVYVPHYKWRPSVFTVKCLVSLPLWTHQRKLAFCANSCSYRGLLCNDLVAMRDKTVAKCHHSLEVEFPVKALRQTNSRTLLTIKKLDLPLPEAESFFYREANRLPFKCFFTFLERTSSNKWHLNIFNLFSKMSWDNSQRVMSLLNSNVKC